MKTKYLKVRITPEEQKLLQQLSEDLNISQSQAMRLGLQLYFDHYANCEVKRSGKKVWKER